MILFNGHNYLDDLAIDGIFNPALLKATAFAFTYSYKDSSIGNIEATAIYAVMNETMPKTVKDYYTRQEKKNIGYFGKDLGIELDIKTTELSSSFSLELELSSSSG